MSCGEVQMYQAYYPYLYQRAAAAGAAASGSTVPPPAAHHRHHSHPHTPTPSSSGHHHSSFGSSTTVSPFTPATAHQYDRFNVQRSLSDNPQPSTSSLGLPSDLYLHSSAAHLSAAATSSTSVVQSSLHHHSGTVSGSAILTHSATSASASHSSAGSVSSPGGAGQGGGGSGGNTTSGISPAPSPIRSAPLGQHKVEEDVSVHERSSTEGPGVDEDDDDSCQGLGSSCTSRAQYVSANCVVFTHYTGDAATIVDQHFSRALDKNSPSHGKDTSPMSARNFPPSFWNSHYQPPPSASGSLGHHMSSAELYSTDPYHPAAVHTTGDPWHTHYQQYTAAAAHHHHRAVHDYHHHHGTAAAAMAHQAAAYSAGLLLAPPPPSRLSHHHLHQAAAASQCKAGPGPGDWQHHQTSHLDTATAAAYAATYPAIAGLEAQVQESSKDLYWF